MKMRTLALFAMREIWQLEITGWAVETIAADSACDFED